MTNPQAAPPDRRDQTLEHEVATLAMTLMAIASTSGTEEKVVAVATDLLRQREWNVSHIPVSGGRACVLATTDDEPGITLSTHLDTVPPFIPPALEGDRLSGRGACDAKGIAASMCLAAEQLRDAGVAVALLFVVGEETTHDGARAANQWAATHLTKRPRVLINGE